MPNDNIESRAKSIVSMGLVRKENDVYKVQTPVAGGMPAVNTVGKGEDGKPSCDCQDFDNNKHVENYYCLHLRAVKEFVIVQQNEKKQEAAAQPVPPPVLEPEEEEDDILEPLPPNAAIQADADKLPFKVILSDTDGKVNLFMWQAMKNLRSPVPRILLSQKKAGGSSIDYINVTDLKDMLDVRVGMWSAEVLEYKQIGEELIMIVRIFVHAKDGDFHSDGTGHNKVNHNAFGDTASNAYAQAFRRACEGLGLARELWRGKEKIDNKKEQRYNDRQPQQQKQFQATDMASVQNGLASNLSDLVTAKQLNMIKNMAKEKGVDPNTITRKQWNVEITELSRKAASALIDHLK